ncbi:MAG TPA: YihY/virulence factor BrkB family protein [Longimicrobiaceae bacterium]|nr:YihY/virulence factor BrkB family protein [Longimicrobiaceae bacterium]
MARRRPGSSVRAAPLTAAKEAVRRVLRDLGDFSARVYHKSGNDDIFFLAGGIAFNFLIAAIPFLLLLIAAFGYTLQATLDDPRSAATAYIINILPASPRVIEVAGELVDQAVGERNRFGILGILLLVWVSTRLIGSLRSALRAVFDIREDRGIVAGKIFDAQMVLIAGTLFVANTAITIALEAAQTYGIQLLGISGRGEVLLAQTIYAQFLAYAFIFLMFVLIYRYLPARRIAWRIALAAATFTAVSFELLKSVFAWYVANVADYTSAYGTLATFILLVFWIYYSAVVFVLGGEVGQVYELLRIRRRQRELLD